MTTMHDLWSDQLSDYVDDELPAGERRALETHLAGCPDCTRTLDELRRVVAAAASVKPRPPRRDLWDGIQERIAATPAGNSADSGRTSRRFAFTMPELAAATVLLATLSGAIGVWVTLQLNQAQNQRTESAVGDATSSIPIEAVASDDAPGADVMPALSFADVQ
jgi:anti-sigma factor RsiW